MTTIIGCDFTSRPTRSKPITLAVASVNDDLAISGLKINRLLKIESLNAVSYTHLTLPTIYSV